MALYRRWGFVATVANGHRITTDHSVRRFFTRAGAERAMVEEAAMWREMSPILASSTTWQVRSYVPHPLDYVGRHVKRGVSGAR